MFYRGDLTRWCKMDWPGRTELISELGRMQKNAAGPVSSKRGHSLVKQGTDEQEDDIVKAYDPRSDLLLLEG